MFLPKHFEETDQDTLVDLMTEFSFATWVTVIDGEPVANHIPFLITRDTNQQVVLEGHLAKGNPIRKQLTAASPSLVIFQGWHHYITPSWYPSKQKTGMVVPTWNYVVVHARGVAEIIEERDWNLDHVSRQTALREAGQDKPWAVSDAPDDYIEKMLKAIVGFRITVSELRGKWKISQNKTPEDSEAVEQGLNDLDSEFAGAMAAAIAQHRSA